MEELKRAVHVTEEERDEMRKAGNLLLNLLDDFEFYKPTRSAIPSLIIEEEVERVVEENVEEGVKIVEPEVAAAEEAEASRKKKGKAVVEEKDELAAPNPKKELIYLEQLGTTIPTDELHFNLSQTFEKKKPDTKREAEDEVMEEEEWEGGLFDEILRV